jgi:FkbM family methyltransferase
MNITKLGSEYGKHYVVLDFINKDSLVYSFGIGEDITFDLELMNRTGCEINAFDPTPKSLNWIKKQNLPEKFKFFEYGLSDKDGILKFDPPPNPEWVSYKESKDGSFEFPVKSLSSVKAELGHQHKRIDFLKLDIEGSEYSVIDNVILQKLNPIQMSVEFHGSHEDIISWVSNNKNLRDSYHAYLFPDNEIFFFTK